MKKIKIIGICGKAGAGKDTLLHAIADRYKVHPVISCTTRQPREGERQGIDYFFMTKEQFTKKLVNDEILEATEFNRQFYGTPKDGVDLNGWNIGVFNPEGISALIDNPSVDITPFYIHTTPKERMIRQLNRENNPNVDEIVRRYSADEKDFRDINLLCGNYLNNTTKEDFEHAIYAISTSCGLKAKSN